ncbi:hypothetical protein D3C87_1689230 [compost metagenome]
MPSSCSVPSIFGPTPEMSFRSSGVAGFSMPAGRSLESSDGFADPEASFSAALTFASAAFGSLAGVFSFGSVSGASVFGLAALAGGTGAASATTSAGLSRLERSGLISSVRVVRPPTGTDS